MTTHKITLHEISSDHHPDLEAAQLQARGAISMALVESIRGLLSSGQLIERDGKIIPNTDHCKDGASNA